MERTMVPEVVGEATITKENQVILPEQALHKLGWKSGDHLIVEVVAHDQLMLWRRPESIVEYFAGKLGHVFGTHEETMRYLEEERRSWEDE